MSNWLNSLAAALPGVPRSRLDRPLVVPNSLSQALPVRELYNLLEAYYLNNGLYDGLSATVRRSGLWTEDMKELRNPAHRVVEFYAAKLWPGDLPRALPIVSKNTRLQEPIERIWRWSNWASEKQLAARWFPMMGDLVLKAAERESADRGRQVFIQVIDPRHVTEIAQDERGFLTGIRIDVPVVPSFLDEDVYGRATPTYYTEVWTKTHVRIWQHSKTPETKLSQLGPPQKDDEHGLGFVPVAYAPLRRTSRERGLGAYTHALSKIDEANRQATRLHSLMFRHNDVIWALKANATDPSGRPLPPPNLGPPGRSNSLAADDGFVTLGGEKMIGLPGNSSLEALIPKLDYGSMLAVLNAHLEELRNELPELRYFDMTNKSGVSGIALRYVLADAIDRVLEARGNAEACLVRAQQMALSLAQRAQIAGFTKADIGTFADGDFEHSFAPREIVPMSPTERSQVVTQLVTAGTPLPLAMRLAGYSDEEQADFDRVRDAETKKAQELKQADQEQALQLEQQRQAQALEAQRGEQEAAFARQKELAEHQATMNQQATEARLRLEAEIAEQQAKRNAERQQQTLAAQAAAAPPPAAPEPARPARGRSQPTRKGQA